MHLHDDWIAAGDKVQDLLNQKTAMNEKYKNDPDSVKKVVIIDHFLSITYLCQKCP